MTKKLIEALATIKRYTDANKPTTLAKAQHMLNLINVVASETLADHKADQRKEAA